MNIELPKFWTRLTRGLLLVVSLCMVLAVLIYPWLHAFIVAWVAPWLGTIGVILGFGVAVIIMLWRRPGQRFVDILMRPKLRTFLWLICATSFALRLVILLIVHWLPGEEAPNIYGSWVFYENSAIYPPGHTIVNRVIEFLLGNSYAGVALFVSAMIVGVTLMVFRLARLAYGQKTARIAALAIAFMPSYLLYGNLEYDLLLGFFEILLVFLFFQRPPERHRLAWLVLYGLLMGFTCLIKPVALVFPIIVFLIYLGLRVPLRSALGKTAIIAVFMLAAICPWTIRNYLVMDRFVFLSTNFGVILHSANNPEATGLEMMMKPTEEMTDEVIMNRMRTRMALEYIKDHPGHFLQLMGYRIVWTWGSDCSFVSNTLYDKVSGGMMNVVRAILQFPYVVAVGLLGIGGLLYRQEMIRTVLHAVLFAPIAYVWALHLFCQTHPQHHLPVLPFILILSSFVFLRGIEGRTAIIGAGKTADA